jgi:hypothetical protein
MPLEATWSNWWGSPELFATVVGEIETSLGRRAGAATTTILLGTPHREHEYSALSDFREVPPERLKGFRRLTASCQGGDWSASFQLSRPNAIASRRDRASLRLVGTGREEDEATLMAALVALVEEGYQPYWGGASIPSEAQADAKKRSALLKAVRPAVDFTLAAVLGAALFLATQRFAVPFVAPLAGVAGLLIPPTIEAVVPRVEIAPGGQTRLRTIRKRLLGSLAAAVGAAVLSLFTGS